MGQKKKLTHLVQHTAWKTKGVLRLEIVLGNFDGRGWLGKVRARLHVRLPAGCLEKGVVSEVGKSAWTF